MRALLINPEFPQFYWSMPELCRIHGCKSSTAPLGLITVAALLPPDWELRLVDVNTKPLTGADWDWAEVVLFSAMAVQRVSLLELIREAKARGKTVVAGGPYPSTVPEEVMAAGCDFLVRGEAELLMPELLEGLRQEKRGSLYEAREKPDLSTSPIPRFDLLRPDDYLSISIQTTRGCPFDCEFCDVVSLFGRKVRTKKPEQVLAELDALYRMGGVQHIFIADDNFIGNKAYARQLLQLLIPFLKERGEPFSFITQASVNLGQNLDIIDLMTEANFDSVFIGVESPDEEVLQRAHKRQNVASPLADSLRAINANGLSIIASFILGMDGETTGAGDRIIEFVEAMDLPVVMLNMLFPLLRTRLWYRLREEGRLREELIDGWLARRAPEMDYYTRMFFQPARPEAEVLGEYFRMVDRLLEPSAYLARAYRSILAMRSTRSAQAATEGRSLPPSGPRRRSHRDDFLNDLRRFWRLSWSQGVKSPCRGQFWRQLYGVWRHNPSRLVRYLRICAYGEDLFRFREALLEYRKSQDRGKRESQPMPSFSGKPGLLRPQAQEGGGAQSEAHRAVKGKKGLVQAA
ncbi:MAG: B12-binding domain-containing radical SAM protein [Desulfobaccales bacterium]